MSKGLATFDRIITFLLGLLLLAAGLIPAALYWDVPYVADWLHQFNRGEVTELPAYSGYLTGLAITAILAFLLGLWFIMANIRSRAFSNRSIAAADPAHGDTVINVQRVAEAACNALQQYDAVARADSKVAFVGDRPTATFTVTADPRATMDEAIAAIESANEDFRVANHTMEIDTVWKLHLDRVNA